MYKLEFHGEGKGRGGRRNDSQGRGGGRGRGRGTGSGRLPNRPPRNYDKDRWNEGRGRGGRGNQSNRPPPQRRPNPEEEEKSMEVQVEDVIFHTFLPKKLPENVQEHLVEVEDRLFDYVLTGISESIKDTDGFPQLDSCKNMIQRWQDIQPKWRSDADEEHCAFSLKREILNQKEGETVPIYIRKQNCTLLITKLDEKFSQLSTFRAMMSSEAVMSSVGSPSMSFPQTCDVIYNKDLLSDMMFLYHLHQLAVDNFELSLPVTKKGEASFTDYRDVPDPFLVYDWIIGILVPANYTVTEDTSLFGREEVTKKLRDQVNCQMSSRAIPFRRSGLWTSIKVVLQLQLNQQIRDSNKARLLYKLIMLRTLAGICQQYFKDSVSIDLDLGSQLIAKLGRRVAKLKEMSFSQDNEDNELTEKLQLLKQKCMEYCLLVVGSLRSDMYSLWRKDASTHSVVKPIVRSTADFQKDLLHEILWLDERIQKSLPLIHNVAARSKQTLTLNMQKAEALKKCVDFQRSLQARRYSTLDAILKNQNAFNSQFSDIDDINERIWVYDTENYIKYRLDADDSGEENIAEKKQNLIIAYFKNAVPRYTSKNDPLSYSQMILVILKSLQWMDKICSEKYPLLLQYESGVTLELFDKLLLPHRQDVVLLDEIYDYFHSRNSKATFPSLIAKSKLGPYSFPVQFAEESEVMREIRQRILDNTDVLENAKIAEVSRVKAECEQLDRDLRARGGVCKSKDPDDGEIHDNKKGSRNFAAITCKQCKINSILRFKRRSVKMYERPLPPDEFLQYAVIFELKIPPDLCLLRDMLALLNFEIMGEPIFGGTQKRRNESTKPPPVEDWRGYMGRQGASADFKPNATSAINSIDFVSPRIATSGTCNAKIENPDVLVTPVEKFVVDNDLSCVYYHEKPLWFPIIKNAADICTFQLDSTCQPDALIYRNLQWTVGTTQHSQSEVIAKSNSQAHRQLPPGEYVQFGSVRADGGKIQLWNLHRAIEDRAVSMSKEPVLALFLQALWQVGPRNEEGDREYHQSFLNADFSLEFLQTLEGVIDSCEGNYSEPLVLMIAVVITVRILEMNVTACKEMCYNLLRKSRHVVNGWMEKIEESLVTSAGRDDTDSVDVLKARQLEAALCSMFSYHVADENLLEIIVQSEEDYVHWFHAISKLHQLTEEEQCHKSISHFAHILLNNARNIPLKLALEKTLKSTTTKDVMLNSLHTFTCERWPKVQDCITTTSTWKVFSEKENPHLLFGGYEEAQPGSKVKIQHFLSLDLVIGTFLVNGFPQTSLPAVIRAHPLFKRFFKNSKFRIQRYSTCARTIDKFHGRYYDFEMTVRQGQDMGKFEVDSLIIREIQEDESGRQRALTMLEPVLFRQVVGSSFAENYTQWLDTDKKAVYFRRLPKQDSDYNLPHDYVLRRDENGQWKFYDERQRKYLLSVHSEGFKCVTAALARLENKEEINVLVEIVTGFVTAKLPRYNLTFNLVDTKLHSVEYSDFRISENENMGTLIGLQYGLLLELGENPDKYSKRILIVPHGYLDSCLLNLKHHHNTIIDLDHLREPPFFVYDYDTGLHELKAEKSQPAWLYLAALHATTSSSLPDPFTQITGTERCMEILQSGHAWPSQPYCSESLETLGLIRSLAPRRSYYAHGISFMSDSINNRKPSEKMEITQWRDVIPSMTAYDGFPFIVDKLIKNSGRLLELHGENVPPQKIRRQHKNDERDAIEESEKLQLRSYHRHLSLYNQAAMVGPEFFNKFHKEILGTGEIGGYTARDQSITRIAEGFCLRELQIISQTRLVNTFEKKSLQQWQKSECNLESFLISSEPIAPLLYSTTSHHSLEGLQLKDLLYMKFHINWLQLYAWARNKACGQSHAFTVILSALAYRASAPLQQIIHLHHISYLAGAEEFPEVPDFARPLLTKRSNRAFGPGSEPGGPQETLDNNNEDLIIPSECMYEPEEIQTILESNLIPIEACGEDGPGLDAHLGNVRADAIRIAAELRDYWPCQSIPLNDPRLKEIFKESSIRFRDAMDGVNGKIWFWYRNLQFHTFIRDVQDKLNSVLKIRLENDEIQESLDLYRQFEFSLFRQKYLLIDVLVDGVQPLKLSDMMANLTMLDEAKNIFESGQWLKAGENDGKDFVEQRKLYADKISKLVGEITRNVQGGDNEIEKKIMYECGITPRITSTLLLQHLMNPQLKRENNPLWIYVGALAVLWSHLKRLNRCIAFQKRGESAVSDLRKEEENLGHEDWSPMDHPEWLLLELELDVMIRSRQVRVARQMMSMPGGKNGVMQLNMGEGKTSVIVPMLCATLANDDALCRVTVLGSIFKTNLNILRFAIGGLLNRRLYTFPCRRNVPLDEKKAKKLLKCLEECLKMKGVILTVPEYRLSFSLLAVDKIKKGHYNLGSKLLNIENWLRYYCRDILDESDELLNVKYQLVYTTGEQNFLESLRWTICQKVLHSARNVAGRLQEKYNNNSIEFDSDKQTECPEQFTTLRLLSDDCLDELKELIANDLLKEWKLDGILKMLASLFLTEEMISEENHMLLMNGLQDKPEVLKKVLLASAYLRRGVLAVALRKRWRVEYGVNPVGERLMAVPFRFKDVVVEKNEFGHPDLAIVLTHLSYYYSGLSKSQLTECLELLKNERSGEETYDDWVKQMRAEAVPPNLRLFHRINLVDTEQINELFEIFRRHKSVIDYWLGKNVFPRESIQFSGKIVMTGWDLCHERNRHPVTGFSGTNDSQDLLPSAIKQHDLDELKSTNTDVEDALLEPQNNENHKGFPMKVTSSDILTKLRMDSIRILIDAGALMLDYRTNEQVADLWLNSDPDIEAVVYFGEDGDEMVKRRRDTTGDEHRLISDVRLEESPFKFHLERCAVYLDDQHTRGVDLKFPDGSRACVTVGSKMKREKLVQACLRMRKLLSGDHSVTFYLSHEAHNKINDSSEDIETKDILEWVRQNTTEFNQDGLLYLCLNGLNYAQKLVALDNLHFPHTTSFHTTPLLSSKSDSMLKVMSEQFSNDEITNLGEMYGLYSKRELLVNIIPIWFEMAKTRLVALNGVGSSIPAAVMVNLERIKDELVEKCEEVDKDKTVLSTCGAYAMEEEQEKELEKEKEKETEMEEEREVQRPGPPEHCTPDLHPNVKLAILNGGLALAKKPGILLLNEIFKDTTFWKDVQLECWGEHVYATEDFARVIKVDGVHSSTNLYLRPVHWVASQKISDEENEDGVGLLVLSPFEVNEMMPYWKNREATMRLHTFCRRRFQNQDLLINKPGLQLSRDGNIFNIPENCMALAPLSVASGNLYFGSDQEKIVYRRFLSVEKEGEVDDQMLLNGPITVFGRDPTQMVKDILSCRHSVLSDVSHVIRLLDGDEEN